MLKFRKQEYTTPYDDNKLKYNKEYHRYLIDKDYVASVYGDEVNEMDEKEWKTLQFQVSDNVYNFIYSFKSGPRNYDKMEYELAKNKYFRETLELALLYQIEYAMATEGDTVQLQHGINIGIDKSIDVNILRGQLMVAHKAILILYQRGLLESTFADEDFDYDNYRKDY